MSDRFAGFSLRSAIWRYGVAILAVASAVGIRLAVDPVLEQYAPYLPFALAIIVAARFGGRAPGLVATALSVLNAWFLFIEPPNSFELTNLAAAASLALFGAIGTAMSLLIGQLRRLEEQARRHAEELQTLMDLAPVGIWVAQDRRCQTITGNRMANELLETGTGENVASNASPGGAAPSRRFFRGGRELSPEELPIQEAAARGIDVRESETDVVLPSGRRVTLLGRASPLRDARGQIRGCVGAFLDITERRRTEEAMLQQREWMRVTLTSIGDAVLATDTDARVTFLNPVAAELTGWTQEQALGRPIHEVFRIIDEDTHEKAEDIVERVLREGAVISLANQTALITRDGGEIPIEDSAAPIRDGAGRVTGVVLVFHDVTEKRRAQEALRQSEQRIRLKLNSILSPEGDIGKLELGDIIDAPAIQSLMDDLYQLARIPMAIVDVQGKVLVGVGWQDICTRFHRVHPETCKHCVESDTQLSAGIPAGECRLYKCRNHMWDIASPIIIGGQHVGNLFSGQFFFEGEPLDYELFRAQAREYGFDEEAYLAALENVPRLSRAAVDRGMAFLMKLGHMLSLLSYSNIKLARSLSQRDSLMRSLTESEERLSRAQQIAHLGSWDLDFVNRRLSWSDEAYRIFGLEPQEFGATYEAFLEAVHPDDRGAVDAAYSRSLREGKDTYEIAHRVVRRGTGEVRWVHEKCEHIRDSTGTILRSIGMVQDVTERKQAEERIRGQNAILEGINRIFRDALTCDTEEDLGRTCLAVAAEATQSEFGFIGEINAEGRLDCIAMSDPAWPAFRIEPPAGHRSLPNSFSVSGIYGRALLDGHGFYTNDAASHPDSIGMPEGHLPLKAVLGVPLKHEGKTIGMIIAGKRNGNYRPQDLEALDALAAAVVQVLMRKRAEQAVRSGEERLRQAQKMESIGVLAGGIAHDFNNLLTSILGNANLLQLEAPPEMDEGLQSIVDSSEKAALLTRQLLAYAGKGQFQISDFDVSRLVCSSADLIRVSFPRNVDVVLDVPPRLPAVRGDSSQIHQVVMNLVINAAEAIPEGKSGQVAISAGIRRLDAAAAHRIGSGLEPGRYVFVSVRDNGCGMDEDTTTKIFDPFFTTKFTGRGLGLAAVQGILRSHKGSITVETGRGQGSTFTVYLPCSPSGSSVVGRTGARAAGWRAVTVLVVDDEEPVRAFTRAALERLGHRVILAENGRQALDALSGNDDIDLVLLDIVMPVVGGAEAFSHIRRNRSNVAVLVASGYSRQEAQRLGIPDDLPFIEKPYTLQQLASAVQKAIEGRARTP